MWADVNEMGKNFFMLTQAYNDAEFAEELKDYDDEDTEMLNDYVLAIGDDSDYISCSAEELGKLEEVKVKTVMLYGEEYDRRCWVNETVAYKDALGRIWLDEQLHDEVFC